MVLPAYVLLASFGLVRHQFDDQGEVTERTLLSIVFGFLEIIGTNVPFLTIRAVIWKKYKHESAVFIAKNIVSLVVGAVEFGVLMKIKIEEWRKERNDQPATISSSTRTWTNHGTDSD